MTTADIDALWQALVIERIAHLAHTLHAFSSDEVWELCDTLPRPESARLLLSNAMRLAAKRRWIAKSDLSVTSRRGVSGGRPLNVWLSVPLGATLQHGIAYVLRQKHRITTPAKALDLFDDVPRTDTAPVASPSAASTR